MGVRAWERIGYARLSDYAVERLGLSARWVRSLGHFMEDWVAWAERVTVRRLREDVEWALALEQTDLAAFRRSGGLPPEARGGPGTRNADRDPGEHDGARDREIGAPHRDSAEETCSVRFFGPADVVQLFRAVLSSGCIVGDGSQVPRPRETRL